VTMTDTITIRVNRADFESLTAPRRSDIPLASAERMAASGMTEVELQQMTAANRAKWFRRGILVIVLSDQSLTISQHDRAVKLGRELTGGM